MKTLEAVLPYMYHFYWCISGCTATTVVACRLPTVVLSRSQIKSARSQCNEAKVALK
jgi:hypothetical protein